MNGRDRRDFLKAIGAGAVAAGVRVGLRASGDDQPGAGAALRDPRYREWSTVALAEAKRLGCSYADIGSHATVRSR